ncbi:hypothetical protein H5U35_05360 [Candidatus Aerophobetes bacterium]|uniref:hypothetical protein n=1 Tax=Thermodesulfovibrio yellowstonii TaxID=28262 RepID=UPI000423FDD7|nr:hypothetical protein [Thermodesulfovibrio islandicus]MBC7189625.1 hypothetical protein [Candidatus Aerophobetes bacterium]
MDEKTLLEIVKKAVREEFNLFKQEVATKEDLKAFATKEDLKALRAEMATKEDLKAFATKEDLKELREEMATKEDLKAFATKEDLNKLRAEFIYEIKYIKSEMVTRDDLKIYITKEDFNMYIEAISERLERFSRGIMSMLEHYERDVRELHKKFELIDFGLLLTHLDRLAGFMEKKEQERIISENQLKRNYLEIRDRVKKIESIIGM